jgi:muramoyltetrapeptide carboxypeptidase
MPDLIKPGRLEYEDTIGLVAPASAPPDPKTIDRAVEVLGRLGFRTRFAPNVRKRRGFLAGSDRERAGDLMTMFTDRKVKALLSIRGGYGSARLVGLLDYRTIRAHAKILIGYSDLTSLHCALLVKAGLVSFHGPMLNGDFVEHKSLPFAREGLLRTVMQMSAAGSISQGYNRRTVEVLRRGKVSGQLVGGNLSVLCTTVGTPFQPSFRRNILFIEDVGEVPYRLDRMLTHLLNAGLLQQVAGVAVGINSQCEDPKARRGSEYRQTTSDVFEERLGPLKVPVVTGLPFGHVRQNATLPVGVRATLDGEEGDLIITEPAVS